MYCPVRITINIIPDTDLKYRTVRLNTGYLPTLTTVVTVNKNVMLTFRLPCYLLWRRLPSWDGYHPLGFRVRFKILYHV